MATKTVLIDDFDGTPISGSASSTTFSLNDAMYQIDLSPANLAKLKEALAPFIKAGRKVAAPPEIMARQVKKARDAAKASSRKGGATGVDLGAVRSWAKSEGIPIAERGRVAASVLAAFAAAH